MSRRNLAAVLLVAVMATACGTATSSSAKTVVVAAQPSLPLAGSNPAMALLLDVRMRLVEHPGCPIPPASPVADVAMVEIALSRLPPDGADAYREARAHLDKAAGICSTDSQQWRRHLREAITQLGRIEHALGYSEAPIEVADDADVATLAAAAVSQHDRLYATLSGATKVEQSPYWYSPTHVENITELRRLVAADEAPTLLVAGNSLAARGIDVNELRAAGFDAMNIGTPGAVEDMHAGLVDEAIALAPDISSVVWILSPDWLYRPCSVSGRIAEIETARSTVFIGVAGADSFSSLDRQLGSDPFESSRDVPSFTVPGRDPTYGMFPPLVGVDQTRIDKQIELATAYHGGPSGSDLCEQHLELMEASLAAWVAGGRASTLVIPPLSHAMAEFHSEGEGGMAGGVSMMAERAERAGAQFIDLSATVPDQMFHDLHHVDVDGRALFTAALIDTLVPN
ncbi:MAG: hypothetical protein ACR2QE_02515 [Acidimicrobiales bacterium]